MARQQGEVTLSLQLIDAFADAPFTGNPAAVVLLHRQRDDRWLQQVAMEMNQAETAFLLRQEGGFSLRWFTPLAEVDLCGHATLASAHYLWENALLPEADAAHFTTQSGVLRARRESDGAITIDLPAIRAAAVTPPPDLLAALGTTPRIVVGGPFDLICVLDNADVVRALTPDLGRIATWDVRGVIVTAPGDREGIDIISRCFFPKLGVPEDPVTGSAHCALAVYWSDVLGVNNLVAHQASARGGTLRCKVAGDRVELTGRAVTTLVGQLRA